jgi:hypothetical protein
MLSENSNIEKNKRNKNIKKYYVKIPKKRSPRSLSNNGNQKITLCENYYIDNNITLCEKETVFTPFIFFNIVKIRIYYSSIKSLFILSKKCLIKLN